MIGNKWDKLLNEEYQKEYFIELMNFINSEYKNKECYPQYSDIFNAFKLTDFDDVKVVILGQDPYHGIDEAHGLAFSVYNNIKNPPSLKNIFKELESDLNIKRDNSDLTGWAKQGVLLLNTVLTVLKDTPLSHKNKGWETFTDSVIKILSEKENIIFILWGNHAQSKKKIISSNNFIIESSHPSPLGAYRGFIGSKPFSQCNNHLNKINKAIIDFSK